MAKIAKENSKYLKKQEYRHPNEDSDRLTIVTAAFYESREAIKCLEGSCEFNRLTLKPYGLGAKYHGYVDAKISELMRALVDVKTEYTLFCDACDTVVMADEDEIMQAYEDVRNRRDLVFCADEKCFPYQGLGHVFEKRAKGKQHLVNKWRGKDRHRIFMNAGVFMGKTEYIKKCLNKLWRMYQAKRSDVSFPEDDQGWWCRGFAEGVVDFSIDYDAKLAMMTKYTPSSWYAITPHQCTLTPNKSTPCVLHFAGAIDTNKRMPNFYRRLYPNG